MRNTLCRRVKTEAKNNKKRTKKCKRQVEMCDGRQLCRASASFASRIKCQRRIFKEGEEHIRDVTRGAAATSRWRLFSADRRQDRIEGTNENLKFCRQQIMKMGCSHGRGGYICAGIVLLYLIYLTVLESNMPPMDGEVESSSSPLLFFLCTAR